MKLKKNRLFNLKFWKIHKSNKVFSLKISQPLIRAIDYELNLNDFKQTIKL